MANWRILADAKCCRTYEVLEKNGSIFIKLGQHLAAMGYLLPLEWTVRDWFAVPNMGAQD